MRLNLINNGILLEFRSVARIVRWDEYADDYDPWVTADQADQVAKESGIRISRNKELLFIALNSDDVVGAVWAALVPDEIGTAFDFDVAVHPKYRTGRLGLELIDAALGDFEAHQADDPNMFVRVHVVNPKLVRVLERKYGFEIEQQYGDGQAFMVYHG